MNMSPASRRSFLQAGTFAAVAASLGQRLEAADAASGLKGRINHSACKWCYAKTPFDELCRAGKEMGLTSIDLVDPEDFDTMKKHGLTSAMISYPSIAGPNGEKVGSIPTPSTTPPSTTCSCRPTNRASRPARTSARNT
jgi:hydroxypyruvate isomerase